MNNLSWNEIVICPWLCIQIFLLVYYFIALLKDLHKSFACYIWKQIINYPIEMFVPFATRCQLLLYLLSIRKRNWRTLAWLVWPIFFLCKHLSLVVNKQIHSTMTTAIKIFGCFRIEDRKQQKSEFLKLIILIFHEKALNN